MKPKICEIATAAYCLIASSLCAQENTEFSLFENLDSAQTNSASSAPGRINPAERDPRNTQATPTFTLVGTSSIGNKQSALLKHVSDEVVRVSLTGSVNPIPGYELYTVVSHGAEQVSIRYPATVPCADFPDQGVSCNSDANVAALSLTTAQAIVTTPAVSLAEDADEGETAAKSARNPFEALREQGRAGSNQAAQSGQFQPRRIEPSDVPPGMRVVSTPFGDRLVQQ